MKGYTHIYTGNGKGKTTAAMGLAMRAVGAGLKVYIGEFIKGMEYGEVRVIHQRFPEITVDLYGLDAGCIIDREATADDYQAAADGLAKAKAALTSGNYDLVILDEITIPVSLGLLNEDEIVALIKQKPEETELVLTGRYASLSMIEAADLVSNVEEVKHYYQQGVLSRTGIDC